MSAVLAFFYSHAENSGIFVVPGVISCRDREMNKPLLISTMTFEMAFMLDSLEQRIVGVIGVIPTSATTGN